MKPQKFTLTPLQAGCGIVSAFLMAAYLAVLSAAQFHRERSLENAYAVAQATVKAVEVHRAHRGGCRTNAWVEFRPVGSTKLYEYYGDLFFLNRPRPLEFLDIDDRICSKASFRAGDTIDLAYVPDDPRISRALWEELSRGGESAEWRTNAIAAIALGLGGMWLLWGLLRRRSG